MTDAGGRNVQVDTTRRSILPKNPGDALAVSERTNRHLPCSDCGFLVWEISAETGKVLYCALCDTRSRLRDALSQERRYRAERDALAARVALLEAEHEAVGRVLIDFNGNLWEVLEAAYDAVAAQERKP